MAYVVQYIHFWGAEIPIETHTELGYTLYVYIYIDELYYGYQPLSNWNAHRRRVKQTNMRMSWGHHEDIVDLPYSYLFLVSCV